MSLTEYTLLAFSSMFVIVDPIAVVPAFVAMTQRDAPAAQLRMARMACAVAAGVLILFALAGKWISSCWVSRCPRFKLPEASCCCASRWTCFTPNARGAGTSEEVEAGTAKDDIAITPLGVPMLAGQGAISTALILLNQAHGMAQYLALLVCIVVVCGLSYLIFRIAIKGARRLSPLALKLVIRLMGLLLAAVAVQFALNGLSQTNLFAR